MTADIDPNATGGQLRTQLENTLSENRTMRDELLGLKAEKIIATKGYSGTLKPEDLKGVALDQLEAKADELHTARLSDLTNLATERFTAQGYQGQELERMVTEFVQGKPTTHPDAAATNRARATGAAVGTPPPIVNPDGLSARQKMLEGLKAQGNKRK